MKIFLTGASSGIGAAVKNLLVAQGNDVYAPARTEFDLSNFAQIDGLDLSSYDIIINCAGANQGTYHGWHNNTWQNQKRLTILRLKSQEIALKIAFRKSKKH
jgi:short-subunit dehydrogenase